MTLSDALEVLGLDALGTEEQVKKAFRAKAMLTHPDVGAAASAESRRLEPSREEAMKLLNAAYETALEALGSPSMERCPACKNKLKDGQCVALVFPNCVRRPPPKPDCETCGDKKVVRIGKGFGAKEVACPDCVQDKAAAK